MNDNKEKRVPSNSLKRFVNKRFESKEDVNDYFSGDRIQCLICGKWFKSLSTHVPRVHGVSVDEYKDFYNLPWGRGLVSEKTKNRHASALMKRIDTMMPPKKVMRKAQKAPKRKVRGYEIGRIKLLQAETTKRHINDTEIKAIGIIEKMEKQKLPACYFCCQSGDVGIHVIRAAVNKNQKLKERYERARAGVPDLVELKTGLSNSEISKVVIGL